MRAIGLVCALSAMSTGCIFLDSGGGGGGDDVASCDLGILCMEIDSGNNSNAGMTAFRGDCEDNGSTYRSASCDGAIAICRNVALVAGEQQVSVVVDVHYRADYQTATGTDPASDCSNIGGELEGAGNDDCPDPSFPVFCGAFEGDCWSPGVDCSFPVFDCGGGRWRCLNADDWASCCDDSFATCGSDFPYACPADQMCYAEPNPSCSTASCDFTAADCDGR